MKIVQSKSAKCLIRKKGCWRSRRVRVSLKQVTGTQHFTVYAEQPQKRGYSESASAESIIESDDDGITLISGKVLMSGVGYWVAIIVPLHEDSANTLEDSAQK